MPDGSALENPRFVDPANRDFHLRRTSICIDTGTDAPAVPTDDLDGKSRPQGAGYDIGAYEYVPE